MHWVLWKRMLWIVPLAMLVTIIAWPGATHSVAFKIVADIIVAVVGVSTFFVVRKAQRP